VVLLPGARAYLAKTRGTPLRAAVKVRLEKESIAALRRVLYALVEAALEVNQTRFFHQRPVHGPVRSALETVALEPSKPDTPDCPYRVQIIRFGDDLVIIALANEVVVDYSLRLKRELTEPDGPAIWVAGYSNAYDDYVASKRVLEEGGYEARCTPWKDTLEERIVGKVHELYARVSPSP